MDVKDLRIQLKNELENILGYWIENTVDNEFGGFIGRRNIDNVKVPGASKGTVLNARILWTFSAAYSFSHKPEYLEMADRAYDYLITRFWDKINGGLFWELNEDGTLLNGRKQTYAQGFGIYGFSEYYRATGKREALDYAVDLYHLLERYCHDPMHGGYIEALSREWDQLEDMRLSPKDANEPKSMNTHLHILEPYTSLAGVFNDYELGERLAGLIRIFLDKILDPFTNHLCLFFGKDWEVRSSLVSYGHDIESSWLLIEAARKLGNPVLIEEVEKRALRIVDAVITEGCDHDGSLFNERNMKIGHLDSDKHWWPQAEAMVGLVYAAAVSGDEKYFKRMNRIWEFIQDKMIDKINGEWFWRVDKTGNPVISEDKVGFWKCPYHNSRAMMEVCNMLGRLKLQE